MMLFLPNPAVIVFFVLSGYVLGESLERNGDYVPFYVRRIFRILPPFVLSVLFAFACLSIIRIDVPLDGMSGFFDGLFWPPPTLAKLWDNLILTSTWINGPTWSIYPEIIGSTLLPFMVFGHRFVGERYRWVAFVVTLALVLFTSERIVLYFYVGFFLSVEVRRFVSNSSWLAAIFAALGFGILWFYSTRQFSYAPAYSIPNTVGAAMLIGAIGASSDFWRWLEIAPLRFLGKISYSFYLLHWPLFYLTAIAVALHSEIFSTGFFANLNVMAISITVCLVLASLSYRFVEMPCIKAGKRLSMLINDRAVLVDRARIN